MTIKKHCKNGDVLDIYINEIEKLSTYKLQNFYSIKKIKVVDIRRYNKDNIVNKVITKIILYINVNEYFMDILTGFDLIKKYKNNNMYKFKFI